MRYRSTFVLSIPLLMSACLAAPPETAGQGGAGGDAELDSEPTAEAAQAVCPAPQPGAYCCDRIANGQLYWGELHEHTAMSLDAWTKGTRSAPPDAYHFAKTMGAGIQIATGTNWGPGPVVTQTRPIDFMAVTDHAEMLSVIEECVLHAPGGIPGYPGLPAIPGANPDYTSGYCQKVRSTLHADQVEVGAHPSMALHALLNCPFGSASCPQQTTAWNLAVAAAQAANDPCNFTAFAGYEWTGSPYTISLPAGGVPLADFIAGIETEVYSTHRNVIFANGDVPTRVFDAFHEDSNQPPELWQRLDEHCVNSAAHPDCDAVTIPHNSNMSNGLSLVVHGAPGSPEFNRQVYYQVAAEVFQHKGNSECDPVTAVSDPDCEFEHIAEGQGIPQNFIRNALAEGVRSAAAGAAAGGTGDNPLQLGMVAASDDHNGIPSQVNEASFPGHAGWEDLSPALRLSHQANKNGPGGITGVWAPQNTREDIFAAIKRREIYATSGPRLRVRIFQTNDPAACSYQFQLPDVDGDTVDDAVRMGGTFHETDTAPINQVVLAIGAYRDTANQWVQRQAASTLANIARVQVIKVHSDAAGTTTTMDPPYDVIDINDPLDPTDDQPFPPDGGCLTWTDPSFVATERAAYYVRVIQEPTWRWTHHDCLTPSGQTAYPIECCPNPTPGGCCGAPANAQCGAFHQTVEERAWTSPIWYVQSP